MNFVLCVLLITSFAAVAATPAPLEARLQSLRTRIESYDPRVTSDLAPSYISEEAAQLRSDILSLVRPKALPYKPSLFGEYAYRSWARRYNQEVVGRLRFPFGFNLNPLPLVRDRIARAVVADAEMRTPSMRRKPSLVEWVTWRNLPLALHFLASDATDLQMSNTFVDLLAATKQATPQQMSLLFGIVERGGTLTPTIAHLAQELTGRQVNSALRRVAGSNEFRCDDLLAK